jgi:glutamate dehydrogenase
LAGRTRSIADATRTYWTLFDQLDLEWIWERVGAMTRVDRWAAQARSAVRDDLLVALRRLADCALDGGDAYDSADVLVTDWMNTNRGAITRCQRVLSDIKAGGVFDLTTLTVAVRQLHKLATASTVYSSFGDRRD